MAASVVEAKISPREVATQSLEAVERGETEVLTDDWTRYVKASLPTDQSTLDPEVVEQWEAKNNPWKD